MTLRCQILTCAGEWAVHRAEIDELLSSCDTATAHASSTWLTSWWDAFGADHELRIGLFWRGPLLVGYAPLMQSRTSFLGIPSSVLAFIGENISDYGDFYSRGDNPTVKSEMVSIILREWPWDEINLINIPGNSSTLPAFESARSSRYFMRLRPQDRCPYIDLRGISFEQYYRALSRNHRRELQKRRHKLEALGSWSLEFSPNLPTAALFDEFRRLHRARCQTMAWSSVYDTPNFDKMFRALFESRETDIEVLWSTLRTGDALMSYTLGFVRKGVYYHWNIGFDSSYEAIAPNKLHHQFLIEECMRRGYVEFDFMRGAYEYKFKWTKAARENFGIRLLKRRGWRRPLNRVLWLKERESGSFTDRCIRAARAIRALRVTSKGSGAFAADTEHLNSEDEGNIQLSH